MVWFESGMGFAIHPLVSVLPPVLELSGSPGVVIVL